MLLLTFYIHHTIYTESGSGFSQKFKSGSETGSEKCNRTSDPLRLRAHLWYCVRVHIPHEKKTVAKRYNQGTYKVQRSDVLSDRKDSPNGIIFENFLQLPNGRII